MSQPSLIEAFRSGTPVIAAELRPPRAELDSQAGMDAWIDMYHAGENMYRDERGERPHEVVGETEGRIAERLDRARRHGGTADRSETGPRSGDRDDPGEERECD